MEQIDNTTEFGFLILVLLFFGLLLNIFHRALQKTSYSPMVKSRIMFGSVAGLLVWMGLTAVLAGFNFFDDFSTVPPRFIIVILIPLVTVILISRSEIMNILLQKIQPSSLIYLQSFRIFVEIILWKLFLENLVPVQMTFEGLNWDILVGISAPVIAFLHLRNQLSNKTLIVWNVISLLLLVNIVVVSILSAPVPFRVFMNEPANTIVATFPSIYLPALLVPLAYFLHILSLKQVLQKKNITSPVMG